MTVTLEKVQIQEKHILRNLYSLYLHDLSAYSHELLVNDEGIFEYDSFEMIWNTEGLSPFLIKVEGKLAGFVLLLEAPFLKRVDYCINDFFLLNGYRGRGYGQDAFKHICQTRQGKYAVEQIVENKPAVYFWKKVYQQFGIDYEESTRTEEDGLECLRQFFWIEEETFKK